ncbi:alpha/beta hydrolase family protein, partial [Vibrio parahaemolyticus V-223/04]
SVHLLKARP